MLLCTGVERIEITHYFCRYIDRWSESPNSFVVEPWFRYDNELDQYFERAYSKYCSATDGSTKRRKRAKLGEAGELWEVRMDFMYPSERNIYLSCYLAIQ